VPYRWLCRPVVAERAGGFDPLPAHAEAAERFDSTQPREARLRLQAAKRG
jgi:hypothetical protein